MAPDVTIVGAGIVGAACAASLTREGFKVAVIDASTVAGGSTAAGMGHLVIMDDSVAQIALTSYSRRLWNALAADLPANCEYERCGTIWIAADADEMAEAERKRRIYDQIGERAEILDEQSLIDAEPNLRPGLAGGLLVPDDSVVYQPSVAAHLIGMASSRGAKIMTESKVVDIASNGVRLENGEFIPSSAVINAGGVRAGNLCSGLKITGRKGHLVITERYAGFVKHQLVELGYLRSAHGKDAESVAFNIQPRSTGQMLVGSSRQFGVENSEIDHSILRKMTTRAFEYLPGLRKLAALRIWTGLRPATPDNLPYIGPVPGKDNIFIAAGHEGLGITTSLGTAELLTGLILGRPTAIPIEPYLPARVLEEV